jgi:hypothetical protein
VYIKLVRNNVKTLYEIRLKTLEPYQQNSLRSHRTRNGKSFKLCITNIKRIVIRQSSYRAFGTQEIKVLKASISNEKFEPVFDLNPIKPTSSELS